MRRCWTYGLIGAVLSVGAPLGLLVLRLALRSYDGPFPECTAAALADDTAAYVYTAVSTAIAFSLFGYLLGRHADRLADLSETDALTGLYNARGLSDRVSAALARTRRYREPLSLLLVDVDGLKRINDTHGHAAGDVALRRVAEAIRSALRETDAAARSGGDEFAILAPNTSKAGALALAERVRGFIASPHSAWQVTGSVGVVSLGAMGGRRRVDAATLMRHADAALYDAKRCGGNRVAMSDSAGSRTPP